MFVAILLRLYLTLDFKVPLYSVSAPSSPLKSMLDERLLCVLTRPVATGNNIEFRGRGRHSKLPSKVKYWLGLSALNSTEFMGEREGLEASIHIRSSISANTNYG